jgi:hypothetical protein
MNLVSSAERALSYQSLIFHWAEQQDVFTGLVLLGLGACYTLQGFRFARVLMGLASAVMAVAFLGAWTDAWIALLAGVAVGLLAVAAGGLGLIIASTLTFAAMGYYLAAQIGLPIEAVAAAALVGGLAGVVAPRFYRRTLPLILTSLHGSAVLIISFVCLAGACLPSMAETFISWSASISFMAPTALLLFVVTGLSVQLNARQGDIETGGSGGIA